jgi:hypothetical protein
MTVGLKVDFDIALLVTKGSPRNDELVVPR